MEIGSSLIVDLSGVYMGICQACGTAAPVVPGGACAECRAPEHQIIREPLYSGDDSLWWEGEIPSSCERGVESHDD
jgi:hypothetical protein